MRSIFPWNPGRNGSPAWNVANLMLEEPLLTASMRRSEGDTDHSLRPGGVASLTASASFNVTIDRADCPHQVAVCCVGYPPPERHAGLVRSRESPDTGDAGRPHKMIKIPGTRARDEHLLTMICTGDAQCQNAAK